MKTHHNVCEGNVRPSNWALWFKSISLTLLLLAASAGSTLAQNDQDLIEVARGAIRADRQAVVAATMDLTPEESKEFWPLYRDYRAEMDKISDGLVKLVLEYAKVYPNVPAEQAKQWLKDYTQLQQRQVSKRTAYLKRFARILPAPKALRLAQVETRLDLLGQLQLAAVVPLVPTGASQ
jgi:hypothetical protein